MSAERRSLSPTARADIGAGIGLGTFPFSNGFTAIDQAEAEKIVSKFTDLGGRYLETAPVYEINSVSLKDIVARYRRDDLFIATKCVTGFKDGARVRSGNPEWIRFQIESELFRLSITHLDLIQAHIVPTDCTIEELVSTLEDARASGKTRYIGLSNVSAEQLTRALSVAKVDFVQNRFSFLHRPSHRGVDEICQSHGIVMNPYQVIERGQLAALARRAPERRDDDIRNQKHEYAGEPFAVVRSWIEELLLPIAKENRVDLETLVIAWTQAQRGNVVPVVGFTSATQVEPVLSAERLVLSAEALRKMELAYAEMNRRTQDQFGLNLDEYRGLK